MEKKIIILSGKQFSGKDTIAQILLKTFKDFKRIGLGDAIKLEYGKRNKLTLDDIERNKSKYRPDLIKLGNWGRSQSDVFWINKAIQIEGNLIIPDVRMKRELEFFSDLNAYKIRVEASEKERSKRGKLVRGDDETEIQLDNMDCWDFVIENDLSLNDLEIGCGILVDSIKEFFDKCK